MVIDMNLDDKNKCINHKTKNVFESFKYAFTGIFTAVKNERNMRIHLVAMILVIVFGFIFVLFVYEWIICIILFGGVLAGEMVNTAIENAVDMVSMEKNEKAKIAKDVAAGAELVWAICSAIVGALIFIPKIF